MRFVLVHGTAHGAWCWERVMPELRRRGHQAIAMDLPGHGSRANDTAPSFAARSLPINQVLEPGDVLVGHSAGGYDITIAADRDPKKVGHLIYLAAGLPYEGKTIGEAMHGAHDLALDAGGPFRMHVDPAILAHIAQDVNGRMIWREKDGPREFFLHDCDEATVEWVFNKMTPAAPVPFGEVISVPRFWRAELPRSYIMCTQDKLIPVGRAKYMARRLAVEPLSIEASHSPFFSRPQELAELLIRATRTRPLGPLQQE